MRAARSPSPATHRRPLAVLVALVATVGVVLAGGAAPAAADPVGPTDYRTEIVEVDPASPQISLAILGGDSFVELAAEPGTEVRVSGYRGEPYLRFDRDGTVWENERSSSRWLNDDRFGEAEIPVIADDEAEPQWVAVADGGVYAWHDHRAHWMNPSRPIGAEPGDVILEAVIPLDVDGEEVAVHVRSELLASPSPVAGLAGAVLAAGIGLLALLRWRRRTALGHPGSDGGGASAVGQPVGLVAVVVGWALLATAAGVAVVVGLPAEAAPGPARWLLPLVAAVVGVAGLVLATGNRLAPPLAAQMVPAALAVAGAELLLWSWLRRQALSRALIPTAAPEWIDRFVVAGAAAVGLMALAAAAVTIRERRPAPRPTR